jgi:hypothetical protein
MLPTEDLFVYVYVVVDDAITAGSIAIPSRPGPVPGGSDGELLTIALVRHLLGRRSEAGFLAEVARDWGQLFPVLPHQSEFNRRVRWLWGGSGSCGRGWRPGCPTMAANRPAPPRCRSSTLPGSAARTAGPARAPSWPPGSAATPRTANGSTASGWRSRPTWAAGSSGPGASCPPPRRARRGRRPARPGAAAA